MRIKVLGTGTSTGVPIAACQCKVCTSQDPKNKRLRCSIYIEVQNKDCLYPDPDLLPTDIVGNILVDTSTDLRQQSLREKINRIDAVLYTHLHADHIYGIDDLRAFNYVNKSVIPVYTSENFAKELATKYAYAFFPDPNYLGASPPKLTINQINAYEKFNLFGLEILPLQILHGNLEILGFRFNNFAYLTDCSYIPEETRKHLDNLEVLIIDGLRERPHKTHFTQEQAIKEIEKISPQKSYLTHISHEVDHHEANKKIASLSKLDIELAYDQLLIEI